MKRKIILFSFGIFIICFTFFSGFIDVSALSFSNNNLSDNFFILATREEGCDSLFGSPSNPESVAWLLQQILNYLKILGPLLVLVLSSVDFAKAIISSDDDSLKKAQKKLVTRLLAAVLLFFIPFLVTWLLEIFGITSSATCGIE